MTAAPRLDLRGLTGAQGKTGRDRPIATGLASARPAANLITPDSFYYATDTGALSYSDGSAWTDVRVGPGAPATSLPASPIDKQQAILTDSLTAPTWQWALQYDAAITGSNKWRYLGGSPATLFDSAAQTFTSSSVWTAITGMSFTIPRAGEYRISGYCYGISSTGGASTMQLGISQNSTSAVLSTYAGLGEDNATYNYTLNIAPGPRGFNLAANDVMRLLFWHNGTNPTSTYRVMTVEPVLLS